MSYRFALALFGLLFSLFSPALLAEKLQLTIETSQGELRGVVTIGLLADKAPKHVERIKLLVSRGDYDGVVFHRVIPGFMAQTGDVEFGNSLRLDKKLVGTGGSELDDLKAEFSDIPFTPGVVGMARSRYIHSANSQFFIMTESHSGLNGAYTVLGVVTEGLNIVREIQQGARDNNGSVANPDVIKKAMIIE